MGVLQPSAIRVYSAGHTDWQNEDEVAYMSNKQLYINEANILCRLFIGNWVIDRSYGFAIKWAGDA